MTTPVQPPRQSFDGPVRVSRLGEEITIEVTHWGETGSVVMSEHNAFRLFASLAIILEVPLSKAVGKAIKL